MKPILTYFTILLISGKLQFCQSSYNNQTNVVKMKNNLDGKQGKSICQAKSQEANDGEMITWDTLISTTELGYGIYISTPICIEETFKMVTRTCIDSQFVDSPECPQTQREPPKCPDGLNEYLFSYKLYCYEILPPSPYATKCKHKDSTSIFLLNPNGISLEDFAAYEPIWYPVSRKVSESYGISYFLYDDKTDQFGPLFDQELTNKEEKLLYDCVIATNLAQSIEFKAVPCDAQYHSLCISEILEYDETCDNYFDNQYRISWKADFDFNKCYYEEFIGQSFVNCELAEFLEKHQSIWSSMSLGNTKIESNHNIGMIWVEDTYRWTASGASLTYSYWMPKLQEFDGSISINPYIMGWQQSKMQNNYCVCQKSMQFSNPHHELIENEMAVTLTIHEYTSVKDVKCFRDDESNYMFSSVRLTYNYPEETSRIYDLELELDTNSGNVWCIYYTLPNLEVVSTEKIFLSKPIGNYVLNLESNFLRSQDPTDPKYIKANILDILEMSIQTSKKFKLAKVSSVDTIKSRMTCVIHLWGDAIIYDEEEMITLDAQLSQTSWNHISSTSKLLSSHFCREETVDEHFWKAVQIGETSELKCGDGDQLTLYRTCEGDYLNGAQWSRISGTCIPNECYEEETLPLGGVIKWDIKLSHMDPDFSVYISTPICIDENFLYVTRKCREGNFMDTVPCQRVQGELQQCPDELLNFPQSDICYLITVATQYPPRCPFIDTMSFLEIPTTLLETLDEAVWYPARGYDEGVGLSYFVYDEKDDYYKQHLDLKRQEHISSKTCSVIDKSLHIAAEDCTVMRAGLCAYKSINVEKKMPFCDDCFQSDYDVNEAKCFCLDSNENQDCQLAELKKSYQNVMIQFPRPAVQIGICFEDDRPVWCNESEPIDYSNWSNDISYVDRDVFLNEKGWSTVPNSRSLCQRDIILDVPEIQLYMTNGEFPQLEVLIRHYKSTLKIDGNFAICFSDYGRDELFTIVTLLELEKENDYIRYVLNSGFTYHARYWCEIFVYPELQRFPSNVMLFYPFNNYVFTLLVQYSFESDPTQPDFVFNFALHEIQSEFAEHMVQVRWMKILDVNEEEHKASYLFHLVTQTEDMCESELQDYDDILKNFVPSRSITDISPLKSSKYCPTDGDWALTMVGKTVVGQKPCLQENGEFVSRTCAGDFLFGAEWLPVAGECFIGDISSGLTNDLNSLLESNETWQENLQHLNTLLKRYDEYVAVDVLLTAKILNKHHMETADKLWDGVLDVLDNLTLVDREVMVTAQDKFNATDKILYAFDQIITTGAINESYIVMDKANIITFVFNAETSQHTGIAVYEMDGNVSYELLHKKMSNEDFNNITNSSFLIATIIPRKVLKQIVGETLVPITIYLEDSLFNDGNKTRMTLSKSVGIILPEIDDPYAEPIPVIFRRTESQEVVIDQTCAYWKYSEIIKGQWAHDGEHSPADDDFIRCNFMHTTHFAFLIIRDMGDLDAIFWANSQFVQVLSTINCILSMLGSACIFLTAVMFRTWRRNKGNQVLLHLSGVTFLQIACIYISGEVKTSDSGETTCAMMGIMLHYAVVSQFCWMMVVAYLQYKRYVQVFNYDHKYTILKSSAVGYVLPMLPIGLLIILDTSSYQQSSVDICYPSGDGLIYALFIPIGIIMTINMLIFSVIIWNVFYPKSKAQGKGVDVEMLFLRFRLVILLFFMLGMTWIFGFIGMIFSNWIYIYLFSILSSGQGFVLFLFFIVFNKRVRMLYYYTFSRKNRS